VLAVACGAFEVHVIKNDGTVWAWGRNTYGNIGDGTLINRTLPVQMVGISDAAGLASGTNFALVYKTDGTFWGCGRNASGQLGDGTFLQRNELTKSTLVCPIIQQSTGISEFSRSDFISVHSFPNPSVNGKFNIEFSLTDNQFLKGNLEIYDLVGKKIYHSAIDLNNSNSTITIDLSNQDNGIYFMTISAAGQRISQKLIKQ
jgi:hypothetical protein